MPRVFDFPLRTTTYEDVLLVNWWSQWPHWPPLLTTWIHCTLLMLSTYCSSALTSRSHCHHLDLHSVQRTHCLYSMKKKVRADRRLDLYEEEDSAASWMANAKTFLCLKQVSVFSIYLRMHNTEPGTGPVAKIQSGYNCHDKDCGSANMVLTVFTLVFFFLLLKYFKFSYLLRRQSS